VLIVTPEKIENIWFDTQFVDVKLKSSNKNNFDVNKIGFVAILRIPLDLQ